MPDCPSLALPAGHSKLLLHCCCATCSGDVMTSLAEAAIDFTVFFYNPNIHPEREYLIRKEENKRFAVQHGIAFVDADYDTDTWFSRTKGWENEPERGARCTQCFDLRFERTAHYAHEHGFTIFATSLGMSRWKDLDQINACGQRAADRYPDLLFWAHNWRKGGGSARAVELAKREHFYRQKYCGCVYSLRRSEARYRFLPILSDKK
ncbi:MAG: epoxyqueuosine reductase QueH [Burkholderiales bacterium]|jgi:predicted adenine nucleotide alpha hydrolase (AANH) superfamily ATPase|nr:epoxyqueuosine reductase QueH [Burkholderiales bacterium]